ncbi:hypothetical protein [Nostoc sp. KVJ3]|uniref:hypothetical protein n=1 Tax=Nostoc sp. KVJ3 TaxID=457945 RepID=UPI002238AC8B|nr:hypothetical protein [Nostoc sp. KVJ3]
MTLDYKNPNDWGRSPLTDRALRLQQIKAENPKQWAAMIEEDIEALSMSVNAEGTEFRDTLAHTQLGANAEKLGGWDNAMIIANAIERGDIEAARELIVNYPESRELVERVITVSEKYRQR